MTGSDARPPSSERLTRAELLTRGRSRYAARDWEHAHADLARADALEPLEATDLTRLADAAYLKGDETTFFDTMERAHRQHVEAGETEAAAMCAFWSGLHGIFRGDVARASGWFARAGRLLQDHRPCAAQGYLLMPRAHQLSAQGKHADAATAAAEARAVGMTHGDAVLTTLAIHLEGRELIKLGQVSEGLSLLDETMLTVLGDELPPRIAGLVYCSVIEACQQVHAMDRAAEWTDALYRFCQAQPSLLTFTGKCLIHRAEVLQLNGEWQQAIDEARAACERIARGPRGDSTGPALYQEGEIRRMRGELSAAEETYRRAGEEGTDPQPGLSLLRLAQGERRSAAAAIKRVRDGARNDIERGRVLPAFVEIMLACGQVDAARDASEELDRIASAFGTPVMQAHAATCRGCVLVEGGEPAAALGELGEALRLWEGAAVPYHAAQTRRWLARACAALGDSDGEQSHLDAAHAGLRRLGANLEVPMASGARGGASASQHGLTPRELEVLRLVASGQTNREIARTLSLSVKTIDRHVSNLLAKLDVTSRAAATAFAYENDLL